MAIHFTWKLETPEVLGRAPIDRGEACASFNARPHWAKVFTMPPARLRQVYGNIARFEPVVAQYDPQGKFRNEFIEQKIFEG